MLRAAISRVRGRAPEPARGAVLPLELYPSPALRVVCTPVPTSGDASAPAPATSATSAAAAAAALVPALLATAAAHGALGLAAPQVGSALRAFCMRAPVAWTGAEARRATAAARARAARAPSFFCLLNPRVVARSEETSVLMEACLSLPDAPAVVRRAASVRVEYVDAASGALVERDLSGLPAAVFQHELDHLDGVLISDRAMTFFRGTEQDETEAARDAFSFALHKYYGLH